MAIGYTGPMAQTMLLKANTTGDGGTAKNIYIHNLIADLQPMLANPFILDLIKNTNNTDAHSWANSRYYYNMKKTDATLISKADEAMIQDPTQLASEDIKVFAEQLAPVQYAKKLRGSFLDLEVQGLENSASVAIADFLLQRRQTKEQQAFDLALSAAKKIQQTITASTTFKNGAHIVENKTYNNTEDLYNDLVDAINSFTKFGQENANSEHNKKIPYVMGIPKMDQLILISPECEALLLRTAGLFASDSGNELFKKAGLKMFLGVPMLPTATLPEGVNFMIITTGRCGAIGYEEVKTAAIRKIGGKEVSVLEGNAVMVDDPNWTGFYRIDISDIYKLGIILPELIIASVSNTITVQAKAQEAKEVINK